MIAYARLFLRGGGKGTCMRGLETAHLTRRQCRGFDTHVAFMANGPLVFIITHLITFPLYNHVWLQHTSLYVKMLSDIPTFNWLLIDLSLILKLTLISLFTMTQLKCIEYWSFLHTNYCFVCHWLFFHSPDWSDNIFQPNLT